MIQLEVWSDFLCPFCYIGKRRLEEALKQFEKRDEVEVTWRSFQLDPEAAVSPGLSTYEMLAKKYGRTIEQAKEMTKQVSQMASTVGLSFDFERAVLTNSFDAHRLAHLAAKSGLQDQMQERLFAAYFVEGKHIGDREVLVSLGTEVGLDAAEIRKTLEGDEFSIEVREDGDEAQALGATGVPLFVLDRKYGVSGAQPVEVFLGALRKAAE